MKNIFYYLTFILFVVIMSSCKKDDKIIMDRDQLVGNYTGTLTKMLTVNSATVSFIEYKDTTQIIEKGTAANEVIIGRGTDLEINGFIIENRINIPQYYKVIPNGSTGITVNLPITGQGILYSGNYLEITRSAIEIIGGIRYKYVIVEKLTKK